MPDFVAGRVKIAPETLFENLEGEMVILCQDRYFSLVDVGTRVWQLIAEQRELDDLIATLIDEYDVDEATLRTDVTRLLDRLIDEGLLVKEA